MTPNTTTIGRQDDFSAAPAWVMRSDACRAMWRRNHTWRCDAARATSADYRRVLVRQAERIYGEEGHV